MNPVDSDLTALITTFQQQLSQRDCPDLRALNSLGLNPRHYGLTDEPYSERAFQEWEAVLKADPANLTARHHLALMYHARAFDREAAYLFEDQERVDPDSDWKHALEHWYQLWETDAFWEGMARTIDSRVENPFPAVRAALPDRLIRIHFDIALDPLTPNYRARNHVRIAMSSRFPQDVKDRILAQAYEAFYSRISQAVWHPEVMDVDLLTTSTRPVVDFLRLYDHYLPALCDLLDLVARIQQAELQKANADENPLEYHEMMERLVQLDQTYDAYISRLDQHLNELEAKLLTDLDRWHFVCGQLYMARSQYDLACPHYEKALQAASLLDDEENIERDNEAFLFCKTKISTPW
jgi:tetratricopeptide (TPR) repeat protein